MPSCPIVAVFYQLILVSPFGAGMRVLKSLVIKGWPLRGLAKGNPLTIEFCSFDRAAHALQHINACNRGSILLRNHQCFEMSNTQADFLAIELKSIPCLCAFAARRYGVPTINRYLMIISSAKIHGFPPDPKCQLGIVSNAGFAITFTKRALPRRSLVNSLVEAVASF